jgi:hypothetical protein
VNGISRIVTSFLALCSVAFAAAGPRTIRDVDFKNFLYGWDIAEQPGPSLWHWIEGAPKSSIRLKNGNASVTRKGIELDPGEVWPFISMDGVTDGDLDGDGEEEAAVHLNYSTGGTANWDYLYVYKLDHGRPRLMERLESGSRAYGGLVHVAIEQGLLILDFADPDRSVGDCCSKGYIRVRYRWQVGHVIETGERERGDLKPKTRKG